MTKVSVIVFCSVVAFASVGWSQGQYQVRKVDYLSAKEAGEDHSERSPLRGLVPPTESEPPRPGGGSGGVDFEEWRLRIHTQKLAAEVLEHYGDQLAGMGWQLRSNSTEGSIAFSTWQVLGDDGNAYHGLLVSSDGVRERGSVTLSLRLTAILSD